MDYPNMSLEIVEKNNVVSAKCCYYCHNSNNDSVDCECNKHKCKTCPMDVCDFYEQRWLLWKSLQHFQRRFAPSALIVVVGKLPRLGTAPQHPAHFIRFATDIIHIPRGLWLMNRRKPQRKEWESIGITRTILDLIENICYNTSIRKETKDERIHFCRWVWK